MTSPIKPQQVNNHEIFAQHLSGTDHQSHDYPDYSDDDLDPGGTGPLEELPTTEEIRHTIYRDKTKAKADATAVSKKGPTSKSRNDYQAGAVPGMKNVLHDPNENDIYLTRGK